nr:putative ribonuclease H-like domain-containing protein [Tanacetum cinerariifolium]
MEPKKPVQALKDPRWVEAMQEELLQFKLLNVWILVDLPKDKWTIGTKWGFRNKKDERGIVIKNKARLVAQGRSEFCLVTGFACENVVFPEYIDDGILSFLRCLFLDKAKKLENKVSLGKAAQGKAAKGKAAQGKAAKGKAAQDTKLLSAPVSNKIEAYRLFRRNVPVTTLASGSVPARPTAYTLARALFFPPWLPCAPLVVSIIGICHIPTVACRMTKFVAVVALRSTWTIVTSHLYVVKRTFRYLKGQPKLRRWYPKDSPFNLQAYSNSDYAGASLDRKSTTGGCQFLGKRLISWLYKKQTIVANFTTKAEYVVAASCCGQVLWIQNQMLDYGFNLMNTKNYINNESTICIMKNLVFHSKTKHIEIRHHFIRDSYEKKLIQVTKISQSSGPTNLVADETVYKEWEDRMERAATTACSLEAEQDSEAQTRFEAAFKPSNDPPLSRGHTLGSREDNIKLQGIDGIFTMASAIICVANNQKFNFSKYILDNMVKNLDGGVKFLMFPRFLQVFMDKHVEGMAKHKGIYVMSSHTKKIFANMRRQGQGFSRNVTPLFETMMVIAQEEVGKGSGLHTDSYQTPTDTQPSTSQPQKKMKPMRKHRQADKVHSPSSEIPVEKSIPTPSNDPLPSGEDSIQLNELMIFFTDLQQQVLDLQDAKIAQAKEIAKLKKRVKKLEKRRKSRPVGLRRLKKGRIIEDIDLDAEIALVDESQGRMQDAYMFGVDDLEGNEVFVDKSVEKEVSTADLITTAGKVVTAASVEDSVAPTTTTTTDVNDELTLAKTLIAIKAAKPNDKGKAKMIEPEIPLKKKDEIALDEDVARKLEAKMRAKME